MRSRLHHLYMKTLTLSLFALLLVTLGSSFASDSVRVDVKLSTDHDDPKGGVEEIVKKQLTVTLSGSPQLSTDRLTIKAKFYADDLTADQVVVEKELEVPAKLENGRAVVNLPEVTFRHVPAHGQITGSGRRSKAKRVPASGRRYHGWALQVMDGARQLGDAYSIASLKPTTNR